VLSFWDNRGLHHKFTTVRNLQTNTLFRPAVPGLVGSSEHGRYLSPSFLCYLSSLLLSFLSRLVSLPRGSTRSNPCRHLSRLVCACWCVCILLCIHPPTFHRRSALLHPFPAIAPRNTSYSFILPLSSAQVERALKSRNTFPAVLLRWTRFRAWSRA
jgi:hypothetical protein